MKKSLKTKVLIRLRNNLLIAKYRQITGSAMLASRWLFVVGCYNSGTTLLDGILQRHSLISGLEDEGVMLTNQLNRPEDFGWTRMWSQCYDKVSYQNLSWKDKQRKAAITKRHWSMVYNWKSQRILLEKSIANTARIPFLDEFFSPAYFIHIVRNGYAVAEGIRRKARPGNYGNADYPEAYPIELGAQQWRVSYEEVARRRLQLGHFIEVSYEDLCENPVSTLSSITDWLEIDPLSSEQISGDFRIHQLKSSIANQNARSLARLSEADYEAIEGEAGPLLRQLNYHR